MKILEYILRLFQHAQPIVILKQNKDAMIQE